MRIFTEGRRRLPLRWGREVARERGKRSQRIEKTMEGDDIEV
jgi:hypothetical protein